MNHLTSNTTDDIVGRMAIALKKNKISYYIADNYIANKDAEAIPDALKINVGSISLDLIKDEGAKKLVDASSKNSFWSL